MPSADGPVGGGCYPCPTAKVFIHLVPHGCPAKAGHGLKRGLSTGWRIGVGRAGVMGSEDPLDEGYTRVCPKSRAAADRRGTHKVGRCAFYFNPPPIPRSFMLLHVSNTGALARGARFFYIDTMRPAFLLPRSFLLPCRRRCSRSSHCRPACSCRARRPSPRLPHTASG